MFATTLFHPGMSKMTSAVFSLVQKTLVVSGLILLVALCGAHVGHVTFVEGLKSVLPKSLLVVEEEIEGDTENVSEARSDTLSPRMRGALAYVSKKYRVSNAALQPIFAQAEVAGRELHLDPLLIIAVIGVESGFNPFSQSVVGAQGLMQVMPRFHKDKLPSDAGALPFFDPLTNVQVGARVLKESIHRFGGVEGGLQQFGGALNDPDRRYSGKVLAERQRLEQAAQRPRTI